MAKLEHIRAVRRVIGLVEGLIAAFDEVADELAQMEDEGADAAMLNTASDRPDLLNRRLSMRGAAAALLWRRRLAMSSAEAPQTEHRARLG
jgi:hypothetical protein